MMKRQSQTSRTLILVVALVFAIGTAWGQNQTFTSSGTFTVPSGVYSIIVECWGSGGAGGGTTSSTQYGGGGGAGGAYAIKTLSVNPGENYTVTVGGITSGTTNAGATGQPSWFGTTGTVYAEGGTGGAAPNGGSATGATGSASNSIGDVVFAGGNGAGGTTTRSGGGGGGAGSTGAGGNASGTTAGIGTSLNGGNGGTGLTSENNGNTGLAYGGGGSGAFVPDGTDHSGGSGAAGLVIVTYQGHFFNSSGTFTAPAGVTSVNVECWGAGGGGSSRSTSGRGGGGGGGAYAASTITVVPGDDYDILVGTGGAANTDGGSSSFNTSTVVAAGGSGGQNNSATAGAGGTVAASTGTTRYAGGNGANGGGTYSGGGGGGAGSTGTGGNAPAADANNGAPGTGTPINGGNGGTGINTNNNGNPGNLYGGGGSGARRTSGTRIGGTGANGLVLITWTTPVFYSTGSGDPSVTSNWETTEGYSPENFTDNFQTFVIKSGHTMTTSGSGWTVSGYFTKVEIQNSAVLTETSDISLSTYTTLQIDDGGTLNHNVNSVSIFSGSESFGNTSTVVYGFDGAQTVASATYGNLTLSGSGSKTVATATVNGILSMEGTATSSAAFTYGAGATIQYKGSEAQTAGPELPATFSGSGGVIFDNAAGVTLSGNATVIDKITMTQGNISTGSYTLALSNSSVSSLTRLSGTITGRFRRTVSTASANYLFPVGTATFYRPAVLNFSSISASTNITAEFVAAPPSGFTPYTDGTVLLNNAFTEGYWRFSNTGTPTVNYSLTLSGEGFTSYLLDEYSRITGRDNSNITWRSLGSHGSLTGDDISRTGVTNLNTISFDFAIATCNVQVSAGYAYERNITFDYTKVAGGSDLNNFPAMISVSGQDYLKTSPTGRITNANGYDIIFTDTGYNKLDHQIEYYNGTNGDLIAWVRIPVLSCSSNTVIKMLYGNSSITTDPSATSVWDSHYRGVWHFDNSNLEDFTSYDKDATPYNTPTYPAGIINNSLGLNGTNEYAAVNNAPNINFAGNITISAWINMDAGGRDQKIAGNQAGPPTGGGYKFGIYTTNKVEFEIRNSSNVESLNRGVTGGTTLSTGQWYYVAGISSDVLDSIKTFVNGIPERPFKKNGTLAPSSNNLTIGKEPFASSWYFDGRFDEMRISDIVRSNGWLRTEYFNQSSPSTFHSVDETETESENLPSESICTGSITLTFGYPAGGTYSGPYVSGDIFTPPAAGTYSITYTYSGDCSPISVTKDIIVTEAPPPPVAPDKEFCSDQITFLQATSGINIRWYSGGTLVSTANPFSTGQTVPGTYTYTVTQTVNGCESAPETVLMTIYSGITINTHPQNSTICEGDNSSFTVLASGYNLTYQWQENGVDLSDGGIYSGTTSATLLLINPGIISSGKTYRCVISSSCGGTSVNSNPATLTVTALPVATFSYPGSPYCINAANPLPVFSGGGVAGTFSSSTGLVFVSTVTGEVNIAASTPGTYTVTNTIVAAGGCGEVTAESPVTIIADLTWTGAANTDWNNTGNWSCGFLPVQTTNVDIPDVANKPVLSTGSAGTCNNIIIATGSSLTVDGNTLRISGTITNNGTFSATTGTIEMNGSSAQSIPPNTFTSNTLGGLTANNNTAVTLEGPLTVTGIVYVTNGTLVSDGFLTLASTASGTALIDGSGSGTVAGNITMQRYLPSEFGYKYFSSPFQSSTVNEFANDINLSAAFPTLYRYDESRTSSGWVVYTNTAGVLNPLHGYALNFGNSVAPKTVDVTGTVNNGTISRTVYNNNNTFTKGFNLAGNPYPSPIDWEAAEGWNNTNIDNALYYFQAGGADEYSGTYSTYINGVPNDGLPDKNIIPSMQGFFVHVTDGSFPVTGTLEMDNRVRITDQAHQFIKSGDRSAKSLIRITARFSEVTAGASDPMVIYFDEKALNRFDSRLDALKLMNTDPLSPNLYAVSPDGYKLSISALPFTDDSLLLIPLGLKTAINGNITFRISDLENLSDITHIYLHDRVNGVYQSLDSDKTYNIALAIGEYNDRFSLGLVKGTTDIQGNEKQSGMIEVYYSRGTLIAEIKLPQGNNKGTFVIYNISGQVLLMKDIFSSGYNEFNPQLKTGIYIVSFMSGNIREVKKIFILNK